MHSMHFRPKITTKSANQSGFVANATRLYQCTFIKVMFLEHFCLFFVYLLVGISKISFSEMFLIFFGGDLFKFVGGILE